MHGIAGAQEAIELPKDLLPGTAYIVEMPDLPPTLHSEKHGLDQAPAFTFELPKDYDPDIPVPLVLYLPGGTGGTGREQDLSVVRRRFGAYGSDAVIMQAPLFRRDFTPDNAPAGGVMLTCADAETLGHALGAMVDRLHARLPNIDFQQSWIGGFSNGAHATALLLTHQDKRVLPYFTYIYLLEGGPSHLGDMFSPTYKDKHVLLLVGERSYGERTDLLDSLMVSAGRHDLSFVRKMMWDTGHDVPPKAWAALRDWRAEIDGGVSAQALRRSYEADWAVGRSSSVDVEVGADRTSLVFTLANPLATTMSGTLSVETGAGWQAIPATYKVEIASGGKRDVRITLVRHQPADAGHLEDVTLTLDRGSFAGCRVGFTARTRRALAEKLPRPTIRIPATDVAPTIDGERNEDIWTRSPLTGPFRAPDLEGIIAHQTRVYGAWDDTHLYLFYVVDEPSLDAMKTTVDPGRKDPPVWEDDSVDVLLDGNADAATYVHLAVNAAGALYSARRFDADAYATNARVAVVENAEKARWQVEMAVPWADLLDEPPAHGQRIRAVFARTRRADGDGTASQYPALLGWNHSVERFADVILEREDR